MKSFLQFLNEELIIEAKASGYVFHYDKPNNTVLALHKKANTKDYFHKDSVTLDHNHSIKSLPGDYKRQHIAGMTIMNNNFKKHFANDTQVHPDHRRKGLATGMYDHYEKTTGNKVHPSHDQTSDAVKFWQNRNRIQAPK